MKAFIDEALHPTGDLATDRILAGKSVDIHIDNTSITLQGIRIKLEAQHSSLNELSKSPKTEDVHIMMQAIRKAQRDVKKLRINLSSARDQIAHHSKKTSSLTL